MQTHINIHNKISLHLFCLIISGVFVSLVDAYGIGRMRTQFQHNRGFCKE